MLDALTTWWRGRRDVYLDHKRLNDEVVRERRAELDADVEYRQRVRRRVIEGLTSRDLPPLINREEFLRRHRRRSRSKVAAFERKEAG